MSSWKVSYNVMADDTCMVNCYSTGKLHAGREILPKSEFLDYVGGVQEKFPKLGQQNSLYLYGPSKIWKLCCFLHKTSIKSTVRL